jgi:hypothetical protein
MAVIVIKGFFDDSHSDKQAWTNGIWTVAGYVGNDDQWQRYRSMWPIALSNHDVPYFHKKEMNDPNGVYSKWHPLGDHQPEIDNFCIDLSHIIGACVLNGFYSSVREDDLDRFNEEHNMSLHALSLATYSLLLQIGKTYPNKSVEVIFDKADKMSSKIAFGQSYAYSDRQYIGIIDGITTAVLAKNESSKTIIELQAADFFAWELRNHHINLKEWFQREDLPIDQNERGKDLRKFIAARPRRKSFDELICRSANQGGIWDYQTIYRVHEARGGSWPID